MKKFIKIKVIPKSSENKIEKLEDGSFKIKLTSPPINGKANEALIKLINKEWKIPKSKILIKKGKSGKNKLIEILK
ncbi:MAG: DUF167 domain-containing protein [Candidatus Magasanikbacteria bacterium]|nr:DUF167 domain-containing protein [Candidatus Magasanikbacteria bacterium]